MLCRASVTLDLRIETAVGPLNLRGASCFVRDGSEDEFLLGRKTMQDIGIDNDRLFEQPVDGGRVSDAAGDDVTNYDADLRFEIDMDDIHRNLDRMLQEAKDEGFEPTLLDELRTLVYEHDDVWRIHVGADPPADVEPL
uniref:Uncharacterized protein n=1 Tax=Phytophthora ramorum TaxID=164328 RepID=H3GUY6_PHYRM